jgi:two-component system nitrogen regulation sensor histidine kinase NtrY
MATIEEANAAATAELIDKPSGGSFTTGTIGLIAVGIALLSSAITFVVLAGLTPIAPTHPVVVTLLLANAATVLVLLTIIGRDVWTIVQARRRGRAGSRLHVQIVGLFSVIAAVPAILVAVVASITLDRGLDRFFTVRNRAIVETSLNVAQIYLREHAQTLGGDIMAIAFDLAWLKPTFDNDREQFRRELGARAMQRRLSAVELVNGNQEIIEKAEINSPPGSEPVQITLPPQVSLTQISDAEPRFWLASDANYVAAAVKLRLYDDTYLLVSRNLDPMVVTHLKDAEITMREYANIEARRLGIQVAFALMYTVIALTVLLSAVWIGFNFANRLVAPIRRLIAAANIVSTGNLYVQVPAANSESDIAQLGQTFNKMTQELRTQRDDIVRARDLIDSRRLFTEAVLAGASAGVIGIDANGQISILNRSAEKLIGCSESDALGRSIVEVVPELAQLVASVRAGASRLLQGQVSITRSGRERTVSVRVTNEQASDPRHGYVITLDDITELVAAQRTSAWADVARRIAHEIKNPLTPIQLSAERLRRKYGNTITDDKGVFEQCTSTIVRQVDDIRRMVDEFSRFARMPKAVIAAEDVADTVRQVVFLQRVGNADIDIDAEISEDPMPAQFDRRLISQALTNIIKNATEAIAAVPPAELGRGHIRVSAHRESGLIAIDIVDNGIGLPQENRSRLLEPYVTTREKGTGLGLAIVGKILEEHGGGIELRDASEITPGTRGTWVRMTFGGNSMVDAQEGKTKIGEGAV